MSRALPFHLGAPAGARARLGLIVLKTDETIEHDFRALFAKADLALFVARIPSGAEATAEALCAMEAALPAAAALLPDGAPFDALGYACTSAATLIGPDRVARLVRGAVAARVVTDPLSAAIAAFRALGIGRIGLVSPYVPAVAGPVRAAFEAAGIAVPVARSFGIAEEATVARISAASVREAALAVGRDRDVEAVFLSCTNLQTLAAIPQAEAALAKPVIGSNLALAWVLARAAGVDLSIDARLARAAAAMPGAG
jgi:maleate isomerase